MFILFKTSKTTIENTQQIRHTPKKYLHCIKRQQRGPTTAHDSPKQKKQHQQVFRKIRNPKPFSMLILQGNNPQKARQQEENKTQPRYIFTEPERQNKCRKTIKNHHACQIKHIQFTLAGTASPGSHPLK